MLFGRVQTARQALRQHTRLPRQRRATLATEHQVIEAGDRVLLRYRDKPPQLTKPLTIGASTSNHLGVIKHEDILGKHPRDKVRTHRDVDMRISIPTLAEYVTLVPRSVTPIYPADASLITSLLDIHVDASLESEAGPTLEILEAGTGNGALTLHLARAIHAANPSLHASEPEKPDSMASATDSDRKVGRGAIVHTVDIDPRCSKLALDVIHGFRRGLYAKDVEFYVDNVSNWIDRQFQLRNGSSKEGASFLSHIILDMPNAHAQVEKAAAALHTDGNLIVFNPSISQIMTVVEVVKRDYLPLILDRVLELGEGLSSGKEWDVRAVVPRAQQRVASEKASSDALGETGQKEPDRDSQIENVTEHRVERPFITYNTFHEMQMICRPKVGERVRGGGFLGVWKKMKDERSQP